MPRGITNTIRVVTTLLNRDVRDLLKVGGKVVDDEFLGELRRSLQEAGLSQDESEWLAAEVRSAWHGRIVQKDELLQTLEMRTRGAPD